MESQWQLLGRPLQPASRIQGRAQELPGPRPILEEQGPREVGQQPADAVPSQKRGGEEPPHRGTDQVAYGESMATPGTTATTSFSNTRTSTRTAWSPNNTPRTRPSGRGSRPSGSSTVSEARGRRATSPRNGSSSLARWASYGESMARKNEHARGRRSLRCHGEVYDVAGKDV